MDQQAALLGPPALVSWTRKLSTAPNLRGLNCDDSSHYGFVFAKIAKTCVQADHQGPMRFCTEGWLWTEGFTARQTVFSSNTIFRAFPHHDSTSTLDPPLRRADADCQLVGPFVLKRCEKYGNARASVIPEKSRDAASGLSHCSSVVPAETLW